MRAKARSVLRPGVYAPVLTPFKQDNTEEIDIRAFKIGVGRLARAGVGLVLSGTLGEADLLARDERIALIQAAKEVLKEIDLDRDVPVIAGVGGGSVRESVQYAKDAAAAGADAAILVAPAYYAFVIGRDKITLKKFFESVADDSPIPVLLYNIPFATGGIDLDADFLMDISEHQNIAGVKLTCNNVSKGHRVALHVNSPEYKERHPIPFLVLPGSTDYMLPALVARQHGCIGGPANLYPKVCVKLFNTATEAMKTGDAKLFEEARKLQDLVTEADSFINRVGFLGIKTAIDIHVAPKLGEHYLGGAFRQPLPAASNYIVETMTEGLKKIFEVENAMELESAN